MTHKQRIYLIIEQRGIVTLHDLYEISTLEKMQVLKAVAALVITRDIKAYKDNTDRYFKINKKPLINHKKVFKKSKT